jgi:hypothetical protein
MNSPRGPYLERLERLSSGGAVETHLDAWAAARGTVPRIEVLACEADPELPGLPAVMAALHAPRVVRYRPGNRCTVRGDAGSGARFVKVSAGAVDDQRDARARWAARASGALSFAVAEPHGWDERTRASWYGVVPGGPVLPLLSGPLGAEVARRIGRCIGELAAAPLAPSVLTDGSCLLARTLRGLARAEAAAPALVDELRTAGAALAHAHQQLDTRPPAPVHGAAHLGQWLAEDTERLGLVDFDRYALGDPEFDLATFLVELRAESGSLRSPADELERAVLDGFRAVAGEPDARRLAVYTVHKLLARAARSASALHPRAEEQASRQLRDLRREITALARW